MENIFRRPKAVRQKTLLSNKPIRTIDNWESW